MRETERWLRRIYISEAVSNIGSRMTSIALSYQLYRHTGRGSDLGWYYMMLTLPGVIFSNPFGRLADRFDRRSLLVYADSTRAAILLAMAFLIPAGEVFWFFPLVFASQVFRTMYDVAVTPLVSDLTQDETLLAKATANLKNIFNISIILGLGVGGFVAGYLQPKYIFMIDAATFVFSALLIRSIPIPGATFAGYASVLGEMFAWREYARWLHLVWEGFGIVRRHEYRRTLIVLEFVRDLGYGVLNPLLSLWPQALFASIPNSLGLSLGSRGAGSIVGGLVTNKYISETLSDRDLFFRLCVMMSAIELLSMALAFGSRHYLIYCAASFVTACFMNMFEISVFAKYISTAQKDQKGAVSGFFRFTMTLTLTLGMVIYTICADKINIRVLPGFTLMLLGLSLLLLMLQRKSFKTA